ncbi:MAG: hypothetical protein QW726_04245 [Fervidicoccaceae archaeon]
MSGKREKIKWYLITSALLYAVIFVATIALFCLWLLSEWLHEWFPVVPYLFYFFIVLLAYVKILKVIGKKVEENGKIVLVFFTAISVILWIMASMLGIAGWSDFTAAFKFSSLFSLIFTIAFMALSKMLMRRRKSGDDYIVELFEKK